MNSEEVVKEIKRQRVLSKQEFLINKQPPLRDVLPCPFCGEQPKLVCFDLDGFGHLKQVKCVNPNCDVRPFTKPYDSLKDAKAAWQKRKK